MVSPILVEAGVISVVVSFTVSFITVRYLPRGSRLFNSSRDRKRIMPPQASREKPPVRKIREKDKARKAEFETSPEHSAVLRKIASDMKSQLKGYTDSISRVPVPVIVPEISTMALWSDLVRNHLHNDEFDFETGWYRYIELMRNHSRMESNLYVDIEALIKEKMVGYSAQNIDNVNTPPPENTVYYNSDLISSIMRNWVDFIRGNDLHYPIDNGTDLGMEDAKKYLKIPDARFLTLYNRKMASGPEVIVEELEGIARSLLLSFHDIKLFSKYRSDLTENEAEIETLESTLREILSDMESKSSFRGICEYSR